jgi:hypothetical protein
VLRGLNRHVDRTFNFIFQAIANTALEARKFDPDEAP